MNFSGIGGITIVVVAALWVFVLIPSWFNASAERSHQKQQTREVKRAVAAARKPILKAPKTKVASLSEQVYRADLAVRAFKFLTWMFALASAALGLGLNRFGFLMPFVVVSAVLTVVAFRAWFMARAAQNRLLAGSLKSRSKTTETVFATNAKAQADLAAQARLAAEQHRKAEVAAREWAEAREAARAAREFKVEPIPAPTYTTLVGSLETPSFAEVVDLGQKAAPSAAPAAAPAAGVAGAAQAQNIDAEAISEILRRRRAANS